MLNTTETFRANRASESQPHAAAQPLSQKRHVIQPDGVRKHLDANQVDQIKWGSATRCLRYRPASLREIADNLLPLDSDPRANDVMIARVKWIGRHTGIELDSGRKSRFFPGDLVGVVFGNRYATRQFYGIVPPAQDEYHMLSQGGVCGQVISAPDNFTEPTVLKPLGYVRDARRLSTGEHLNLRNHVVKLPGNTDRRPTTITVIGSSMDAGKTTTAAQLINGLTKAGKRVGAAKITGTGCVKDINRMKDAGAVHVMDFVDFGHGSTFRASGEDLEEIVEGVLSHFAGTVDYLILELADGIIQQETAYLLDYFTNRQLVDHYCLAVHDALSAPMCERLLAERFGIEVRLVSGAGTATELSTNEIRALTDTPVLTADDLASSEIISMVQVQ